MKSELRWRYFGGVIFLLAVASLLVTVFFMFSATDKTDLFLMDTRSERFGWRYELLLDGKTQEFEPEFTGESILATPDGTQAIRATRTMTEERPMAELEWSSYFSGVEVFLGGRLLHSDFQGTERNADGFLLSAQEELRQICEETQPGAVRKVRLSLPPDYQGKELCVITYFQEGWQNPQPEYPSLGSNDSLIAPVVTGSVLSVADLLVCAILALLLAGMFLLDISNGKADVRTLILCLYFVMLFLDRACHSGVGDYSLFSEYVNLQFLSGLYIAPLCVYLAFRLTKWKRYLLCAGTVVWALYEGTRMYLNIRQGNAAINGRSGLGAFLLFLAVALAFCLEIFRRNRAGRDVSGSRPLSPEETVHGRSGDALIYGGITVAVTAVCLFQRIRARHSAGVYFSSLYHQLLAGNFTMLVSLIADISSLIAVVALGVEFIRRTLRTRQEMAALRERSRLTLESYNRLLDAEKATNAVRHDILHHLTALSGILQDGDAERARRYVNSLSGSFSRLPAGRYSRNLLVNVIAGTYLDRARTDGIRVKAWLDVPVELNIADEDLSVLLSNMLQNALEACGRMAPGEERYIHVRMRRQGDFLFIRCVNSTAENTGTEDRRDPMKHGYGLVAMRRVAEKYAGGLLSEQKPGRFEMTGFLSLKPG